MRTKEYSKSKKRLHIFSFIYFYSYFIIMCTLPINGLSAKAYNRQMQKIVYDKLINDLREHWQSPITYLKRRGYLPDWKHGKIQNDHLKRINDAIPCIEIAADIKRHAPIEVGLSNLFDKSVLDKNDMMGMDGYLAKSYKAGFFSNMKDKFLELFQSKSKTRSNNKSNSNNGDSISNNNNSNNNDEYYNNSNSNNNENDDNNNNYGSKNSNGERKNQERLLSDELLKMKHLQQQYQQYQKQHKQQKQQQQQYAHHKQQQQRRSQQQQINRQQYQQYQQYHPYRQRQQKKSEPYMINHGPLVTSLNKSNAKIDDLMKQLQLVKIKLKMDPKNELSSSCLKPNSMKNIDIVNNKVDILPRKFSNDDIKVASNSKSPGIIYYG